MARGERIAFELEVASFAEGDLVVWEVRGREALSEPFAFEVRVSLPSGDPIALDDLLGQEAKLLLRRPDGTERVVHGEVERGRLTGVAAGQPSYELRIAPRLARLAAVSRSRIFQDLSVADVVAKVLDEHQVKHRASLSDSYPVHAYVVQHQESDLAFVSRLLEEEGIAFLFEHERDGHELVLFDDNGAGPELSAALPQRREEQGDGGEYADRVASATRLEPGAVALRDFDLERPAQDLTGKAGNGALEVYEYPDGYVAAPEGKRRAAVRLAQARARAATWEGTSTAVGLLPGARFEVEGAARLFCVSLAHEGKQERRAGGVVTAAYRNAFVAAPAETTWRPPRRTPRARALGLETAIVTGPQGEEIHVDRHGRVKVQFHWDREGKKDDRTSCWARVAQRWAGAGMGTSFVPRVGQEVLVRFLAGDGDRPLVVGAVYDGVNRSPIQLPGEKTRSTQRTSSSAGGDGSNELCFEDQAGEEELYLHAQKDFTGEVLNDRTAEVRHAEGVEIGKDLKQTVLGNRTTGVGGDAGTKIDGGQTLTVALGYHDSVAGNADVDVGKARTLTVGAARTVAVALAADETVGAASALTVGGAYAVNVGLAQNTAVGGARLEQIVGMKKVLVAKVREEKVLKDRALKTMGEEEIEITQGSTLGLEKDGKDEIGKDWVLDVTGPTSLLAQAFSFQGSDTFTIKVGGKQMLTAKKSGDVELQLATLTLDASSSIVLKGAKVSELAGGSGSGQARSQQTDEKKSAVKFRFKVSPQEAGKVADKYVLEATDGSYKQQKTVKSDKVDDGDSVEVKFTDAPVDKKYRLKVVVAGGTELLLLDGVPFHDIAASLSEPG